MFIHKYNAKYKKKNSNMYPISIYNFINKLIKSLKTKIIQNIRMINNFIKLKIIHNLKNM